MAEDVNEQPPPLGFQPHPDAGEEPFPVRHMLEHLDRDDPVEYPVGHEGVHIRGDDTDIGETALGGLRLDIAPLRRGIRDSCDGRTRKALGHEQCQRPPAATKFQDRLSVGEIGVRDGFIERQTLGIGQLFLARRIKTAGIFAARPKRESEELGRQFIVLFVGGVGMFGYRVFRHCPRELFFLPAGGGGQFPSRAPDQERDAHARQLVGERRAFGGADH